MGYDMILHQPAGGRDVDHFHFNISGMSWARGMMEDANMLVHIQPAGEWPNPPEDYDHEHKNFDDEPQYIAYVGQQFEAPGIPAFKFSSNDGWLVQPDECKSAIRQWERNGSPVPRHDAWEADYWMKWIAYLKLAADHGGFRVW